MSFKVAQSMRACKNCHRPTLHYRNTKEMNWVMHLVLACFTVGIWLVIWWFIALYHLLTKSAVGNWFCSVCGNNPEFTP